MVFNYTKTVVDINCSINDNCRSFISFQLHGQIVCSFVNKNRSSC